MRALRGLAAAALLAAFAWTGAAQADGAFSPSPWIEDLDQLRDAMSAGYPNLEWAAARGMDLPATYARARGRLETARDEAEARRAFDRFIRAFADGHLEIQWPDGVTPDRAGPPAPPQPLCTRLGYFDVGDQGAIASRLPGFRPVGAAATGVSGGVLAASGRKVAVLRVPIFEPQGFPALCARIVAQAKLAPDSPCDDACKDRLGRMADAAFIGEMEMVLRALAAERPDVLLVDISDNGGGNDSSIVLARMVTAMPLSTPRVGFVRTSAWADELAHRQADLREGIRAARGGDLARLRTIDAALTRARAEAAKACDRSVLWRGANASCWLGVTEPLFAGGLSPAPPEGLDGQPWAETISATARFPRVAPLWRGPLLVLVDGNSASSSELFAAMLQDQGAAMILGAPTFGAGCGHMTGAEPVVLRHGRARVSMPDCFRLRADGSNEVAGIEPDMLIGFRQFDTAQQRTNRLARALPEAVRRATEPK